MERAHRNLHRVPHNRLPFDEVQAFIKTFAEVHALPLPGRMPNHKEKALLLPSAISKVEVHRRYQEACAVDGRPPVSWPTFHG